MPKGKGKRKAQPPVPPSSEQQAQAEGLVLRVADNKTGYFGVHFDDRPGKLKPYQVQLRRGGKLVSLGYFATAEEAALCVARSPEGQAIAAEKAAAASLTSEEGGQGAATAMPPDAVLKEEGTVPLMPPGAFVKDEEVAPAMPPGAVFKEEGVVPPAVKEEHAVVVEEELHSQDGRPSPKRQRRI